jgi:hypothetical protein
MINTEKLTPEEHNWSEPIDGIINVPDELDPLVNSIAFQLKLHTISQRFGESEMICRMVYVAEKFFKKKSDQQTASLQSAYDQMNRLYSDKIDEYNVLVNELLEVKEAHQTAINNYTDLQLECGEVDKELTVLYLKLRENVLNNFTELKVEYGKAKAEITELKAKMEGMKDDIKFIDLKIEEPEDTENVLWWKFPICEPPYVGSMNDDEFLHDYYTHWQKLQMSQYTPDNH